MPSNKEIVKSFFNSEFYKDENDFKKYIHPEVEVKWNGSTGFLKLNYQSFRDLVIEMGKSFMSMEAEISHIIEEDNQVAIRFSYHVEMVEEEEMVPLADFICIWEIKDNLLYKGFFVSQPSDANVDNLYSFFPN
ncbi:hypothetical protein [Psychroflexus planctonicus]|uniref:SnoaL-like domain-containing protein n=1 Tax=Psychroflexus planctonicus TaxID=1526575 RepID=A0ABQ1SG20_9FLAO|nr:hypothetical protein [Psychroflexus planctonicus]GGE27901.1 hypothetical protein GCM10010832_05780 [Psychroflexus planctonicus]